MGRCVCSFLVIFSIASLSAAAIAADGYPVRLVRFVVGYAPGGGNDTLACLLGQKLGERLAQTFVVDNRPGAASMLGTTIVAKAAGDSYPLMANVAGTQTENMTFFGGAMIVSPKGVFLAQGKFDEEDLIVATLEEKDLFETRKGHPFLRDRRPSAYQDLVSTKFPHL